MIYPQVISEYETVWQLQQGKSIARFGDGELKLMDGKGYFREPACEPLTAELLQVFQHPHENCLVGIPTMDPLGPKCENWLRHRDRFAKLLQVEVKAEVKFGSQPEPKPKPYYSAFITRPDSAPWINCLWYARQMEKLWWKKRAAVLCEPDNSILKLVRVSAKKVSHVPCPHREAYAEIDRLEKEIRGRRPDVALLSCGPTATCLANRLAARGIHAIDIGSAGGFLLKLLLPAKRALKEKII